MPSRCRLAHRSCVPPPRLACRCRSCVQPTRWQHSAPADSAWLRLTVVAAPQRHVRRHVSRAWLFIPRQRNWTSFARVLWSCTSPITHSIASRARQTATASYRTWPVWLVCATFVTATRARTTSTRQRTTATHTSHSTNPSASRVAAVYAPAARCREHSRLPSKAADSTPRSAQVATCS